MHQSKMYCYIFLELYLQIMSLMLLGGLLITYLMILRIQLLYRYLLSSRQVHKCWKTFQVRFVLLCPCSFLLLDRLCCGLLIYLFFLLYSCNTPTNIIYMGFLTFFYFFFLVISQNKTAIT